MTGCRWLRIVLLSLTVAWLAQGTAAAATAPADRAMLVEHLERTRAAFLAAIDGTSEAQWRWKPAPDRWSIAEVSEHITLAERFLLGLARQMMAEPAAADLLAKTKGKEEMILRMIPDRSQTAQAPEPLLPTGSFDSRDALLEAFRDARQETLALAGDPKADLRAHATNSPIGELDALQWLLFVSAHTERHTKQIEEVRTAPGFPR